MLHAKALYGNPYDGHSLGPIIAEMQELAGVAVRRTWVDKGYRGTRLSEQVPDLDLGPGVPGHQCHLLEMRWHAGIEPVIRHLKAKHPMERNCLGGCDGNRANAFLANAGHNFALLLRWFEALLRTCFEIILRTAPGAKPA